MREQKPFDVYLEFALSGPGAVPCGEFDAALADAGRMLDWLQRAQGSELSALLHLPRERDDLSWARPIAEKFVKNASEIFIFGIGGIGAGTEALLGIAPSSGLRISVKDNLDPASFSAMLARSNLKTTKFAVISKGGGTIESVAQTLAAAKAIEEAGIANIEDHFVVVTEPGPRPMRTFAQSVGCPIIDHPPGIGGRYSMLSVAGLFPLLLSGQDAVAVREGAATVLDEALSGTELRDIPAVAGAALHVALCRSGRLRETVIWSYADRLAPFNVWWRQLWAESLGKGGRRSMPIGALGPVDQHSQSRLFFDGPSEALFTLVSVGTAGVGSVIPPDRAEALGFSELAGKTIGDLVAAQARAMATTLYKYGRPVRRIHLPKIDERSIGALFMHFMLETVIVALLLGVDPFDQPAITEHKPLARKYLATGC